jgi:hypothetical protein
MMAAHKSASPHHNNPNKEAMDERGHKLKHSEDSTAHLADGCEALTEVRALSYLHSLGAVCNHGIALL